MAQTFEYGSKMFCRDAKYARMRPHARGFFCTVTAAPETAREGVGKVWVADRNGFLFHVEEASLTPAQQP